jgi:S1-C subfamily serine protease
MTIRSILLLIFCCSYATTADAPTREKLRAQLAEASQELARVSRAVNLIHELVAPSVVSIHTSENFRVRTWEGWANTGPIEVGEGSGFVFHADDKASYVLTNAHVVLQTNNEQQFIKGRNGQPIGYDSIRVVLTDNREVQAEYVGVYVESDLAVLKIPLPNIPALEFANSDEAKVGDYVVALGYPLGVGYSATSGIISATDRSTNFRQGRRSNDSFIQTDAAINPGNSGGPLVNITGRVIGVNARIISKTGVNIGLGLAIPSNLAQHIGHELRKFGKVRRPMIGINMDHLDPEEANALGLPPVQTVRITGIIPEGPAAEAGLLAGDAVLAINETPLYSLEQFQARVARSTLGDSITLRVWRNGKEFDLNVLPVAEETLKRKLQDLATDTATKRGFPLNEFGLWLAADDQVGLHISTIEPGSIAEKAGLKVGGRLLHEQSHGTLSSKEDITALNKRRELIVQVYQEGRSFWLRLQR